MKEEDLPPSYEEVINSIKPSDPPASIVGLNVLDNYQPQILSTSNVIAPISNSTTITTTTTTSSSSAAATLNPYPYFNVNNDVFVLFRALQNNPDINPIINVLCHRSIEQRAEISKEYFALVGRQLTDDINRQIKSNLKLVLVGLSLPYLDFLSSTIHLSVPFKWLLEILFTIPNDQIIKLKSIFESNYHCQVDKYIEKCIHDNEYATYSERFLLKPLLRFLEARRNENEIVSPGEVHYDVNRIANIKPMKLFGADKHEKDILRDILYYKSFAHICAVCEMYHNKYNQPVMDVIERCNFSHGAELLCNIAKYALNKNVYFAHLLKSSTMGLRPNDRLLTHIIVYRSEIDLADIKVKFQNVYKRSFREWVRYATSGHYKYALYALMGEQRSS